VTDVNVFSPVRLALVGVGGHGTTLQDAIEATDRVEMRAVYDVEEAVLDEAAERFDCAAAASYEALLRRDDLEAVVLATPNALHRQQCEAAFEAGLDVLVEKPIANTVADGRAIVEGAEAAGRTLMVGHDMRRSRGARRTRELLDDHELGAAVSMEIHFSTDTAMHLGEDAWRLRPGQCPLLPMMQLGIHGVDLVQYFFRPIAEVHAFTRSVTTPDEVVDSVAAAFQTRDGVHGTMISNYCSEVAFEYRISGTAGTLRSAGHTLRVSATGEEEEEVDDYSAYSHESYRRQMEVFAKAIREGIDPETNGWVGLQALAVVEALQQSAEAKAPQSVPDVHSLQAA